MLEKAALNTYSDNHFKVRVTSVKNSITRLTYLVALVASYLVTEGKYTSFALLKRLKHVGLASKRSGNV